MYIHTIPRNSYLFVRSTVGTYMCKPKKKEKQDSQMVKMNATEVKPKA